MDVITYNDVYSQENFASYKEKEFKPVFDSMLAMAEMCGSAGSNVKASPPEEYWRRTIFVPFLGHLIQEF